MSDELKSFLISVSVILAISLFIPCIETLAKLVRRRPQNRLKAEVAEMKPVRSYRRNVA